jgi:hypothetical protein
LFPTTGNKQYSGYSHGGEGGKRERDRERKASKPVVMNVGRDIKEIFPLPPKRSVSVITSHGISDWFSNISNRREEMKQVKENPDHF